MKIFPSFKIKGGNLLWIPAFLLLLLNPVLGEDPSTSILRIENNSYLINNASSFFNISPQILSAIIYIERTLNYDWTDDALDVIIASAGQNSSIGFCQVKLKTAYWIEVQLGDSTMEYYPGEQYAKHLQVSKSTTELIEKLTSDSLNILYAAAYLRIIQSHWSMAGYSIDNRPDIIGTLYSTGLFKPDASERLPNDHPIPNEFGRMVAESVHLFNL